MSHPLIIDIETQHSFQEVGYNLEKLKISVVGLYDYGRQNYFAYFEKDLNQLFSKLEHASHIIGFNINKFDLPVLAPYYVGKISQFSTTDILAEVEKVLGFRVALDDLAQATLGTKKKGHGLLALEYFKNKDWDKLKNYCLEDVKITKNLYEYGQKNKILYIKTNKGNREIPVVFAKNFPQAANVSLSLPF